MEKEKYERLKEIKTRIFKGEKVTFAERNIVNMENKRIAKKKRDAEKTASQQPSRSSKRF